MNERARAIWDELLEGNRRFREGRVRQHVYTSDDLLRIEQAQHPKAAVIACSDSRVIPSVIFDQGIGDLFVSRVPGNVASDGARWMVELAVGEFEVPLVVVLAHTKCLAVTGVMEWKVGAPGGSLRLSMLPAVMRAQGAESDRLASAIQLNALQTIQTLFSECPTIRNAVNADQASCVAALYDLGSGAVTEIES